LEIRVAQRNKAHIRIGVGGWTYAPWRGTFYPAGLAQKRELEYASRKLNSIEINGTFYGAQKPESYLRWRDATPDDFVFSLKAPRFATHRRILAEAKDSIERFVASGITELGHKLGPINWQFATTKQFDADDFEAFLQLLPKSADGQALRHALEVRHPSFDNDQFVALARRYEVAIVYAGDSVHPQIEAATAPFAYARIMGTSEAEPRGYSEAALDDWIERAKKWTAAAAKPAGNRDSSSRTAGKGNRDVYLYVISGFKERNPLAAMALLERL
jgi:uncharacterized protein YecE (DUF72 family)